MSWGTKIAVLYIGFAIMIGFMAIKSNNEKIDLVSADYYAQELKFQDKIDGENNMNSLSEKVMCETKNKSISITFPDAFRGKETTGEILFYRPSDASLDVTSKVLVDSLGNQKITNEKFKRGIYHMQIKCSVDKKNYYYEQQIFMN